MRRSRAQRLMIGWRSDDIEIGWELIGRLGPVERLSCRVLTTNKMAGCREVIAVLGEWNWIKAGIHVGKSTSNL